MLYKKIHRQHVRQFWMGRRFEYRGDIYEITKKPRIGRGQSRVVVDGWFLISLGSGRLCNRDVFKWLD